MAHKIKFGNGVWANQEGSTLAYNDENENYKPLPFKVTRGSTATRVNKQGLVEVVGHDTLRIDYTDSDKGVALLEPSRTNLFDYGITMQNWSGIDGVSFITNNAVSPDGSQNATKITYNGTFNGRFEEPVTTTVGTSYTYSVYMKNIDILDPTQVYLGFSGVGQIEQTPITNEWKRYSVTFVADGTTEYPRINSNSAGSLLAYGAQMEASTYMTSLIPTNGSVVTRQADVVNSCGNSEVFNDSEGVLSVNIAALSDDLTRRQVSVSNGSATDVVRIHYNDDASNRIRFQVRSNNVIIVSQSFTVSDIKLYNKALLSYKLNDVKLFLNGFKVGTDGNTSAMPSGLNTLNFNQGNDAQRFYGKTKEVNYYDTAMTDLELEYLTSYRSWESMVNEMNLNIIYNG